MRKAIGFLAVLLSVPAFAGVVRFSKKHVVVPAAEHSVVPAAKAVSYPARHPKKSARKVKQCLY